MKLSFIPCIFQYVGAIQTLIHSLVGQHRNLTSCLAAGRSHIVHVCSYIHTRSQSTKNACWLPIWSYSIQFGMPCWKHPSLCLRLVWLLKAYWCNHSSDSVGNDLGRDAQPSSLRSGLSCLRMLSGDCLWRCCLVTVCYDATQWTIWYV